MLFRVLVLTAVVLGELRSRDEAISSEVLCRTAGCAGWQDKCNYVFCEDGRVSWETSRDCGSNFWGQISCIRLSDTGSEAEPSASLRDGSIPVAGGPRPSIPAPGANLSTAVPAIVPVVGVPVAGGPRPPLPAPGADLSTAVPELESSTVSDGTRPRY